VLDTIKNSNRNNINLNINLARLPDQLIDYAILHQLTHIHIKTIACDFGMNWKN